MDNLCLPLCVTRTFFSVFKDLLTYFYWKERLVYRQNKKDIPLGSLLK